jgi:hypothetical protein
MKNHSGIWQMVLFSNEFIRATLFYILLPLIYIHRFNLTIEWVGLCTSCQFAADAITKVSFGIAASRGYSHWMIRGGSAVSCTSVLGFQFFHNPYLILLFSISFGIGAASVWPAALSHFSHNNFEKQGESLAKAVTPWMAGTGVGMFLPNILIHRHQTYIYFLILIAASTVFLGSFFLKPAGHENTPSYRREILFILILFRKIKLFLAPMVIQAMVIGMIAPSLICVSDCSVWNSLAVRMSQLETGTVRSHTFQCKLRSCVSGLECPLYKLPAKLVTRPGTWLIYCY